MFTHFFLKLGWEFVKLDFSSSLHLISRHSPYLLMLVPKGDAVSMHHHVYKTQKPAWGSHQPTWDPWRQTQPTEGSPSGHIWRLTPSSTMKKGPTTNHQGHGTLQCRQGKEVTVQKGLANVHDYVPEVTSPFLGCQCITKSNRTLQSRGWFWLLHYPTSTPWSQEVTTQQWWPFPQWHIPSYPKITLPHSLKNWKSYSSNP